MADHTTQKFIIARLADYCDFRQGFGMDIQDPVLYMWEKLKELEDPLYSLKQELLVDASILFFTHVRDKQTTETELADYKQLLDGYLSGGDFADALFHLDLDHLSERSRLKTAVEFFKTLQAHRLLDEEMRPEAQRSANWNRLVGDLYRRLELALLETVMRRKPMSFERLRFMLRRCRRNTADYCAVFHFPLHPGDTFTPFIVPRVEALIAANRRFLVALRRG